MDELVRAKEAYRLASLAHMAALKLHCTEADETALVIAIRQQTNDLCEMVLARLKLAYSKE